MTDNNTLSTCAGEDLDPLLPSSPFTALNYHFGMLLGVDDLQTEQSYHKGKRRLHNAWQHGEGVAWGFGVESRKDGGGTLTGELVVNPGLALDAAGRELYLAVPHCVDLGLWYEKHKDEAEFEFSLKDGGKTVLFDFLVTARFKACAFRAVPAIAETCAGSATDTAYSRIQETVELLIRSKRWKAGRDKSRRPAYPRLRWLFGLESAVTEKDIPLPGHILQALQDRHFDPSMAPDILNAIELLAAADSRELMPGKNTEGASLFPEDPSELVLAQFAAVLQQNADGRWKPSKLLLDWQVPAHPALIPTAVLQELLFGLAFPAPNKAGPRLEGGIGAAGNSADFDADQAIDPASLSPEAFELSYFDPAAGWSAGPKVNPPGPISASAAGVHFGVTWTNPPPWDANPPKGGIIRLRALGSGPQPILGENGLPLAGRRGIALNDPLAGADAVFHHQIPKA